MSHILVVDDEPAIVTVVRERLEREGFAVRTAASGGVTFKVTVFNQRDEMGQKGTWV